MNFIEWFVENENTIMHCIVAIAITLQLFNNLTIFRRLDSHDRQLFAIRQNSESLHIEKEQKSVKKVVPSKSILDSLVRERRV